MATQAVVRSAALGVHHHGSGTDFEVELFGPVVMPSGEVRSAHEYRRYVQSPEMAQAMIGWWLDGEGEPVPHALAGCGYCSTCGYGGVGSPHCPHAGEQVSR